MSLLRIEHLNKAFGSLVVTNDINLEVAAGERHVIIGPNGAGKTTLIHQIGGQARPDTGRIWIDGVDVTRLDPEARAQAGLARTFQKNTLFQRLSVFENVRLGVQARFGRTFDLLAPVRSLSEINARTHATLAKLNLEGIAQETLANLSYGDQRQVEVAAALAGDPKLLLLDEPTSGLSPAETRAMIDVIKGLPGHMGVIVIEHDMEVVFSVADRITVLYYGAVLASGPPQEVAANERVREVYLGASL